MAESAHCPSDNQFIRKKDVVEALNDICSAADKLFHLAQNSLWYVNGMESFEKKPVVKCFQCKWYGIYEAKKDGTPDERYKPSVCLRGEFAKRRDPDWFCADGKRKDDL